MSEFEHVHRSIDEARSTARSIHMKAGEVKWIVLSDHHRGSKDGADDFLTCESTYRNALNYYHKAGFTLLLLGDVEEFWENPLSKVMNRYSEVLKKEKEFYKEGRLIKIWGNHDDAWRYKGYLQKHLHFIFPKITVHEAVKLIIEDERGTTGEILFIHGHQGTLESDRFAIVSKFFVRYIWRNFQRLFNKPLSSTPAKDVKLKSKHDQAMYSWAKNHDKTILVCGHTHQPVFMSLTHVDKIKLQLQRIELILKTDPDNSELMQAKKALLLKLNEISESTTELNKNSGYNMPYYFNTGCCSFSDGDITGLEISGGTIKLVKWKNNYSEPEVLESEKINNIFST